VEQRHPSHGGEPAQRGKKARWRRCSVSGAGGVVTGAASGATSTWQMRVCAMSVEKYRKDLETMKNYYYEHYRNPEFCQEAEAHQASYAKSGGTIFGGEYMDES
jgi:hypothetical protein